MPAQTPSVRPGAVSTALVVEDSANAAEQLAHYLREANIHVQIHPRGAGALEQAAGLQPDVIILDLLMPDISGWEVLGQLKAEPRTREIPVIIVSVMDDRERGLGAGAAAHLVKPVNRELLWGALQSVGMTCDDPSEALMIAPQQPGQLQLLLVEDNEMNVLATVDYLREKGFTVLVSANGREALAAIAVWRPDLIITDIQMPEIDGLELIQRLRAIPAFAQTPIIALTALAMPGDRERCLTAGASAYLTKPVRLRELLETIHRLLGGGGESDLAR